jgi:transcription termination factor Rho
MFPAIDMHRSGTRRDDLLLDENMLKQIRLLRRMMAMISADSVNSVETTERIIDRLRKTKTNADFLANLGKES